MTDEKPSDKKVSKKKPKSSLRKISAFLVFFLVLGISGASLISFLLMKNFTESRVLMNDIVIDIPLGSGVAKIADILHQKGVIDQPLAFRIALRFNKLDTTLKAGEYLFPAQVSPEEAATILSAGKSVLYRVTFAEGLTSTEIIGLLNTTPGLQGVVLHIPSEGSLLPETYSFPKNFNRHEIVKRMQSEMHATLDELWPTRQAGLPFKTKEEAIILASIVEKETGVSSERTKVAGVFVNRLKKRMRLQSDPTVSYGITRGEKNLGRGLTRKDLKGKTPYNTYVIRGLPPTAISNPGRASLQAVLNPANTDAFYFVADGTGGHAFAKTLKQHNRNVAKWRKIERSRK